MEWLSNLPGALAFTLGFSSIVAAIGLISTGIMRLVKWVRRPSAEALAKIEAQKEFTEMERMKIREEVKENQIAIKENQKEIRENQQAIKRIFEILDKDNKRFENFEIRCNLIYKALWALVNEGCTDDSSQEMKDVKKELQDHMMYR